MPRIIFPQFENTDDVPEPIRQMMEKAVNSIRDDVAHSEVIKHLSRHYLDDLIERMRAADLEAEACTSGDKPPSGTNHLEAAMMVAHFMLEKYHDETIQTAIKDLVKEVKEATSGNFDLELFEKRLNGLVVWARDAGKIAATTKILQGIKL